MPQQKHLKTKKTTTDKSAIKKLKKLDKSGIIQALEDFREADKRRAEYGESLLDTDGRMRTKYSQTVTDTGRLSSRKTDWGTGTDQQNLPIGFRHIIIADEGKILLEGDLEQAEARIVAWLAQDEEMMSVFALKKDIHRWNASKLWNKWEVEVTDEERYVAKRVVHAFNYGLGPIHAAELIGCSVAEAKMHKARYFKAFPRLVEWQNSIRTWMKDDRTLITPLGRRRLFLGRPNEDLVRKMLAFIPQSTCVDYLNKGLVAAEPDFEKYGIDLLIQTHDGFLLQCPPQEKEVVQKFMVEKICVPIFIHERPLTIPLRIKTGANWGEMN